jgi:hypothetical protein
VFVIAEIVEFLGPDQSSLCTLHPHTHMAKKGTKATRKFAASGQLKKKIQARRKHQQIQRKVDKNKSVRNKGKERARVDVNKGEDEEKDAKEVKSLKKRYVVLNLSRWMVLLMLDIVSRACQWTISWVQVLWRRIKT